MGKANNKAQSPTETGEACASGLRAEEAKKPAEAVELTPNLQTFLAH